ncbi:MAG: TSUP family transporter, partial [Marinobacter sp.]
MSLLSVFAVYMVLGAFAGTLAGLFGIGGGLIIVPVLIFSFGAQGFGLEVAAHMAVGTSLATIVFTSISSIRSHHGHGAIRWDVFRPMAIGIVAGALIGAWTAALLSGAALELIIGIFVILVGIKMLLDVNNIYVNSINHGYDAEEFLASMPTSRILYGHIAGHFDEADDL